MSNEQKSLQDDAVSQDKDGEKNTEQATKKAPSSLAEKTTLGVAFILVASLAFFLGWHGFQQAIPGNKNASPRVTTRVDTTRALPQPQGWAVPVEVTNTGNVPLREVVVTAEVREADGKPGEREVSFGFLAEGASETVYVTTFADPRRDAPEATVQSFQTKAEARGY